MLPTLYFLRSSEQHIIKNMLRFAYRVDECSKKVEDIKELEVYSKFYGLTTKDLGLYALSQHTIAGAVWIRLLNKSSSANGFVDENTPVLSIGVKPEFRLKGIGSMMMEQLLLEAGVLFEQVSVSVIEDSVSFFEKFGFKVVKDSTKKSPIDSKITVIMVKKLEDKLVRPTDGYDSSKWLD